MQLLGVGVEPSAPAAPFDPSSISGLQLWLKADALALADNDPVTTWTDSSGLGHDYTQGTAANKPTYKTAILNGEPVIRLDGTNDYLDGPASSTLISASARTVFVVGKTAVFSVANPSNAPGAPCFLLDVDTYHGRSTDSLPSNQFHASHYDGAHKLVSVATDTSFHYWTERHESGTLYLSQDGGAEASIAAGNVQVLTALTRIGTNSGSTLFLNGDIAEILVYNVALSAGDRTSVQGYIESKYAL